MNSLSPIQITAAWLCSILAAFATGYKINDVFFSDSVEAIDNSTQTSTNQSNAGKSSKKTQEASANRPNPTLEEAEVLLELMTTQELEGLFYSLLAQTLTDPKRSENLIDALEILAAREPLKAMELAGQIESLRDQERAKQAILEVWAEANPYEALAWAKEALPSETRQLRSAQMEALFRGFATNNPLAAFQAAKELGINTPSDQRLRLRVLEEVIETQIENGGIEQAKMLVEAMPEGSDKENLMRDLVNDWARYDPVAAANYVDGLGDNADTRLIVAVAGEWAENNPEAAAAWISQLPADDPAMGDSVSRIIREWSRYDLNASAEWLNSLPASPELDRAVASYTFQAAQEDPASAMSWAESISSDWLRTRMMGRVASEWGSVDSEGLQTYLKTSGLDAEQQQLLLNSDGGGRRRFEGGNFGGGGGNRR